MSHFQNPQQTWNERFAAEHYVFGEAPNAYLSSQAVHLSPGNALAVADGEGRNGVWLAQQGLQVDAFEDFVVAIGFSQPRNGDGSWCRRISVGHGICLRESVHTG